MIVQRQGKQERIIFRSVPKDSEVGWLYSVHLDGPRELKVFKQILGKFLEIAELSQTDPFAKKKQKLGTTSQHEFWLNLNGHDAVLDFSDPKNAPRGGMSMLGEDTVAHFAKLSAQYESLAQLLDMLREGKVKLSTAPEQASRGRGEGKPTAGSDTRSSKQGGNARPPNREQGEHSRTLSNPEVPRAGQSADYRRGWEETYEIAKQSGESRRRSQSSQFGSPIESQITALRSTLRSLEGVPVELRGESWRESYDVTKGRLDGLIAGLEE